MALSVQFSLFENSVPAVYEVTRSDITFFDRKLLDASSILSLDNDCFACLTLGCRWTPVATLVILGAKIYSGLVSLLL